MSNWKSFLNAAKFAPFGLIGAPIARTVTGGGDTAPKPAYSMNELEQKFMNFPDYQQAVLRQLFSRLGQQLAFGQNQVSDAAAAANLPAESRLAALRGYQQKFNQFATNAIKDTSLGLSQQQMEALRFLLGLRQQDRLQSKEFAQQKELAMLQMLSNLFNQSGQAAAMLL